MIDRSTEREIATHPDFLLRKPAVESFPGFRFLSANFTYTPNQFFDVCLPHSSRGVVRLVAYMLRQTLGYCDADGRPQIQRVRISYSELIDKAGISKGAIREALDEAVAGNFITCTRRGERKRAGDNGAAAEYELRWDDGAEYLKDPKTFKGFFEGGGNRTDIPNQLFDHIIPNEPLSVVKVVGSVLRFTVGFKAARGGRRQQAPISYQFIQNYTHIGSRRNVSNAIQEALEKGYIVRVSEGVFDPNNGKDSKAAIYSVRWEGAATSTPITPKREPGVFSADHPKKGTGITPKREPEDHPKKGTDLKTKPINKIIKQQQPFVAVEDQEAFAELKNAGFDGVTAAHLAQRPVELIRRQVTWLSRRGAKQNPLGLLRKAIEEDWSEPVGRVETSQLAPDSPTVLFVKYFYAGMAGSSSEPTATPSSADLEASEPYCARLLAEWPNPSLAPKWGSAFAKLCLSHIEGRRPAIISFAALLRSYGDEFAMRNRQAKENQLIEARNTVLAHRERELMPLWVDYLREQEEEIKRSRPDAYAAFLKERKDKLEQLLATWPDGMGKRAFIERNSAEYVRLKDLQAHFASDILDFRAWEVLLDSHALV